jgi:hypothetical protein
MYGLMLIGGKHKNHNNLIGINYYFMIYLETYIIYKHEKMQNYSPLLV